MVASQELAPGSGLPENDIVDFDTQAGIVRHSKTVRTLLVEALIHYGTSATVVLAISSVRNDVDYWHAGLFFSLGVGTYCFFAWAVKVPVLVRFTSPMIQFLTSISVGAAMSAIAPGTSWYMISGLFFVFAFSSGSLTPSRAVVAVAYVVLIVFGLFATDRLRAPGLDTIEEVSVFVLSCAAILTWSIRFGMTAGKNRRRLRMSTRALKQAKAAVVAQKQDLELAVARRTAELEESKAAAEAASEAKSRFLANMSHEVRTPLNGVLGMTALLKESPLQPDQGKMVDIVLSSAQSLLTVVNDILDFSKIHAGQLTVSSQTVDLRFTLQPLADLYVALAQQRGLEMNVLLPEAQESTVACDPERLKQVVSNLLSNALKFTEKGKIELRAVNAAPSETGWVIEVEDSGIGIPEHELDGIFDEFSQVDDNWDRRFDGTGLGLAICKNLMQLMGGTIDVRSVVGRGSTFRVTLPRKASQTETREVAPNPTCSQKSQSGLPILVVEKNKIHQKIASKMLNKLGYRAVIADCESDALALLARERFSAILIDYETRDSQSLQTIEWIQNNDRLVANELPIIVVSADKGTADQVLSEHSGINEYLRKPIKVAELAAVLQRWIVQDTALSKELT